MACVSFYQVAPHDCEIDIPEPGKQRTYSSNLDLSDDEFNILRGNEGGRD